MPIGATEDMTVAQYTTARTQRKFCFREASVPSVFSVAMPDYRINKNTNTKIVAPVIAMSK